MTDLHAQIQAMPRGPGIYFFYDAEDRLLYIGKSVHVRQRVRSYFGPQGGHNRRTSRLKDEANRLDAQPCGSELEALLLESRAIKQLQPLYNIRGRSYHHYPFLKIADEPFARVQLTYELLDDGARYFGPFPSEYRAHEALEALRPLFRWRSCAPLPRRACLEASIGRCSAPCVGGVGAEAYAQQLDELAAFLSGQSEAPLRRLESEMQAAAEALQYERAAVLRDRLALLAPLVTRQQALQAALNELDCLVILPEVTEGEFLWLVVRRGRLVHSERGVTARRRRGLARRLAKVLEAPPPSLDVQPWELDELNIMAGWLHKHRESEQAISLAGRSLETSLGEAFGWMAKAKGPARRVAEAVPVCVARGPGPDAAGEAAL